MKQELLSKYSREFLTIKEIAFLCNVSEKSIRRAIKRGLFNPSVAFRKILIPADQVSTFYDRTKLADSFEEREPRANSLKNLNEKRIGVGWEVVGIGR